MSVAVKSNSVLMIGAHDSGKSNFLMRLWLALDAAQGILVKDGNPRELDYLRNGAAALLTGKYAGHTSSDVYERVEIAVKNNPTARVQYSGTLFVPDLAGEQIPAIYRNRQWSQAWEDQIQVGCSCLLFVRIESKELVAPLDWVQCSALLGGIIPEAAGDAPSAVDVGGIAEPGENSRTNAIAPEQKNLDDPQEDESEPERPPTQVVLVDWLQFLRAAFTARAGGDYKPRIGIVVSAWDKAPADQQTLGAAKWVSSNLPMLADFCDANDAAFDFQYFGVTVTDGDLEENATFKAEYLQGNPRKAGRISHSLDGTVQTSLDMTLPVAWALGVINSAIEKGS